MALWEYGIFAGEETVVSGLTYREACKHAANDLAFMAYDLAGAVDISFADALQHFQAEAAYGDDDTAKDWAGKVKWWCHFGAVADQEKWHEHSLWVRRMTDDLDNELKILTGDNDAETQD